MQPNMMFPVPPVGAIAAIKKEVSGTPIAVAFAIVGQRMEDAFPF
jgi:hypothetical protein